MFYQQNVPKAISQAIIYSTYVSQVWRAYIFVADEIEKERSLSHALAKFHLVKPSIQLSLDMCLQ